MRIIMIITIEIKKHLKKSLNYQQESNLLQSAIKCLWEASLNTF